MDQHLVRGMACVFCLWAAFDPAGADAAQQVFSAQQGRAAAAADFHVSPQGSDAWSGRFPEPNAAGTDGPFASLERARDAVRARQAETGGGSFVVRIRGGLYRLERPVVFGLEDSVPEGHRVRYVAAAGEEPVFSAATPVAGWRRPEAPVPGLPAAAQDRVWVADVGDLIARIQARANRPALKEAPEPVVGERLRNGRFELGTVEWSMHTNRQHGARVDFDTEPGEDGNRARIQILNSPGVPGHIQLQQHFTVRGDSTYTLRLRASADAPCTISAELLEGRPPFAPTIREPVELGPEPRTVEFSARTSRPYPALVSVVMGDVGERTIRIEEVSLVGPDDLQERECYVPGPGFFTLFQDGRRLPRARLGGFPALGGGPTDPDQSHTRLRFDRGMVRNWPDIGQGELVVIPTHPWQTNILPIESVDEQAGEMHLAAPATYTIGPTYATQRQAFVENVLAALDQPGEWVLDTSAGRLYLWPREDGPPQGIVAPLLTEMIRIEGQIDYDGPADRPVRGLSFEGLTFTHAERYSWHGLTGWGLQHDWEMFDAPSAMVRLRGAEEIEIVGCRFVNAGASGLRVDLHGQRNRIEGNLFERLGGMAVLLAGYGPGTKDVNRDNAVLNNHIHHVGEIWWGYPALFLWQSGQNRVAHNLIHHVPYTGIAVTTRAIYRTGPGSAETSRTIRRDEMGTALTGDWWTREPFMHSRRNLIEYNELRRVVEITSDGNGIYISGTGRDNRVQYNHVLDCPSPTMCEAIRCDDDQHETIIHGNVMHRIGGMATGIAIKGINTITNNVIADPLVPATQRGLISLEVPPVTGSPIQRNIVVASTADHRLVSEQLIGYAGSGMPIPRLADCAADHNLYYNRANPQLARDFVQSMRAQGVERHSLVADPGFLDPEAGDYRLAPDSPARRLGIESIDISRAGLEPAWRQRLIGRQWSTRIEPDGGLIWQPVTVSIVANVADAVIHYTQDGSRPDRGSARYTGPFSVAPHTKVRAVAYAPGGRDVFGSEAWFQGPPRPLREDFMGTRVGDPPGGARVFEAVEAGQTVRVSDEQAVSGGRSLEFRDGPPPAGHQSFLPYVHWDLKSIPSRVRFGFSIRLDEATDFYGQLRQNRPFAQGPTVRILPGGRLVDVRERELATLPLGQWIRCELSAASGIPGAERFDLRIVLADGTERIFPGLESGGGYQRAERIVLVAQGVQQATFYVDDLLFEAHPPE